MTARVFARVAIAMALAATGGRREGWAEPAKPHPARAAGVIVVEVAGFRSAKGSALIGLFGGEKGFPDGAHAMRRLAAPIVGRSARAVFRGVPAGTYAVSVLHDEDGDRAMDTSWIGAPAESYGASNDARRRFGPPPWSKAKFVLASGATVVQKIRLVHP